MGKYKLTTIRTTLATAKRLNQLKKEIGAKSIDELLTTLMNMYKIQPVSEYVEPIPNDVDKYFESHDLVWQGGQVVGIPKQQGENNNGQ